MDAIILAAMAHKAITPPPLLDGFPVVLVNAYSEDDSVPAVVPDERRSGLEATAHLRPTLTTMQLPHHEMGRRGMQALLGLDPLPRGRTLLHCPLVERASVGRCEAP